MALPLAVLATLIYVAAAPPTPPEDTRFAGIWEARFQDTVVCKLRFDGGDPIKGESVECHINVDENGDLRAPESTDGGSPTPIANSKVDGDTLRFEIQNDAEVIHLVFRLVGDGIAQLTIPEAPVRLKPIPFKRR